MTMPGRNVIASPDLSGRGNPLARYLLPPFRLKGEGFLPPPPKQNMLAMLLIARSAVTKQSREVTK